MPAIQRISDRVALADYVAFDREDRPIVIVAADDKVADPEILPYYLEVLQAIRKDIPFVILANPEEMTIYRKNRTRPLEPVATIPTKETLRFYSPGFGEDRVFADYLAGMIDAWLRDFMRHWKSETPPQSETMAALGLAGRLENGWSKARVRLACPPLRRNQLPDGLRDGAEPGNGFHPLESTPVPPADHA